MGLYLVILHLLSLLLKFGQDSLLLFPTLVKGFPFLGKDLQFFLYLIHLERDTFTTYSLSFYLQLTDAAVKFRNRFRN